MFRFLLSKFNNFPWKEYLGLCLFTTLCGVIYSSSALREIPNEPTIEFFKASLQEKTKRIGRFPNLSYTHTQDQALVAIVFISAGLEKEATTLLEGMGKLQNRDGSWNSWYTKSNKPSKTIEPSAIAWMVIAFNQYREHFKNDRFIEASDSAIRYLSHLKLENDSVQLSDLPIIASAFYHFQTRLESGSSPYRPEAIKIRTFLDSVEFDTKEADTSALIRLGLSKISDPGKKLKYREIIENSCLAQLSPESTPSKSNRQLASKNWQPTPHEKDVQKLLNEKTWPLILAAELDGFHCFGQKTASLFKSWIEEHESIEMIGNPSEVAWAYFAKQQINPLTIE